MQQLKLFILTGLLFFAFSARAQIGINPSQDASRTGVIQRGMIIPRVEATKTGIRLTVDTYSRFATDKINLELQISVTPQKGGHSPNPIKLAELKKPLSEKVYPNGKQLKFDLSYDELNQSLHQILPNATHLKIGPGTPLMVFAQWPTGHTWGGSQRGGLITIPGESNDPNIEVNRPTGLDVAATIDGNLANRYQVFNSKLGLKVDGQIRSRVEGEGKFQVYQNQLPELKEKLFELAKDPAKAQAVLGKNWKLTVEDRYMKRDDTGQLILAEDGFPIPDPMVDTYYDNEKYDGAKNDMAIRYRWTEGNKTGAWNFKPGIGRSSAAGVMYRLEYGVDATSERPSAISRFADSQEPLNPFKKIRQLTGQRPSTFFKPSVKIVDKRYKFKLEHANGLIVEVSLDDAIAENLRANGVKETRFAQLEMDIDHLATQSTTSVAPQIGVYSQTGQNNPAYFPYHKEQSLIRGGISLHEENDLKASGPVISLHAKDFRLASQAIVKLRKQLLGDEWMPGAQKYALAAEKLNLVSEEEASKSVRDLHSKELTSSNVALLKHLEGDLSADQLTSVRAAICKKQFTK